MTELNTTSAIDRDVWIPFMAAYPALDAALALSTCSADYIHAGGPAEAAQDRATYLADFQSFFEMVRGNGDRIELEFRFTQRILGDGVASERGLFRMDVTPPMASRGSDSGTFTCSCAWRTDAGAS